MAKSARTKASAKASRKNTAAPSASLAKRLDRANPAVVLCCLYAAAVLLRHLLSIATTNGPIVYIDEGLYVNLARGLAFDGAVTYRAMPTSYVYLTYPLALVPLVRFLPAAANLYRAVQLYNALIMTSALFPAYLLARRMELDRPRAYLAALFTLLLPDMVHAGSLMSECMLYPLFLWLAYFGWLLICGVRPALSGALCAVLTALLYFTKPGYVVFGAVLLIVEAFFALRSRDKRRAAASLCAIVLLALLIAGGYALYARFLDSSATLLTHYDKQIPQFSAANVLVALQASALHLIAFALSVLGMPVLLPFFARSRFSPEKRRLLYATLLALVVAAVGTAIMVSLYEWRGTWLRDRLHLRYLMCYALPLLPLMMGGELEGFRLSRGQLAALAAMAALFIFPGGWSGFTAASALGDSPSLAAFHTQKSGWGVAIAASAAAIAFLLWLLGAVKKRGLTAAVQKTAVRVLALFLLMNTVCVYNNRSSQQIKGSPGIEAEAQALAEMIAEEGETPLVITTNRYDNFRGFQSDMHLHRPTQYVVSNNLLLDMLETGGVYRPFVPVTQAPNTQNLPTIDTTFLVFDATVADYIELTGDVQSRTTPGGLYTLARIPDGKPFMKTALSGLNGFMLSPETTGSLIVYDEALLDRGSLTLHITMRSSAAQDTAVFTAGGQTISIPVTSQSADYAVELPVTACEFWNITLTSTSGLVIAQYRTE